MCFGCGEKGDIFSFVQKMDGLDFPTALKQLAERAGVELEKKFANAPEQKEKKEKLREVCEEAVRFFEAELKNRKDVQEYIRTRGVMEETVVAWRLGYAPAAWDRLSLYLISLGFSKDDIVEAGFAVKSEKRQGEIFDRFRGRIIFPIFDSVGQPIAVSGRFFEKIPGAKEDSDPAKYINSPETELFRKSRVLYGYDRAFRAMRKADCILLVEGQFDLILAHQSGIPFAVALSGTALTSEHLMRLGRLSKRLVLALDADAAGIRAGLKSAHMALGAGFDVKIPAFPAGKDPADLARENPELLKAAVRTSKTAVEFFLNALQFSARDERGYKKIVEAQVLPLIAAMESRIDQEYFARIVSGHIDVSETAVMAEIKKSENKSLSGNETYDSSEVHEISAESLLTPLQKKAGMLLFKFGKGSETRRRLESLLGEGHSDGLEKELAVRAEELRFRFDRELGEHTSEEKIAEDILADLKRQVERERVKMKFV